MAKKGKKGKTVKRVAPRRKTVVVPVDTRKRFIYVLAMDCAEPSDSGQMVCFEHSVILAHDADEAYDLGQAEYFKNEDGSPKTPPYPALNDYVVEIPA